MLKIENKECLSGLDISSELNQPELIENKPVSQLRLVQDGLEMMFEVRIKLVPHLIVLSD